MGWDHGRLARKRAGRRAVSYRSSHFIVRASRSFAGGGARGPNKSLDRTNRALP